MHAQDFLEPNEIHFGQNTNQTKKAHTSMTRKRVVQIISKDSNQPMIEDTTLKGYEMKARY